MSDQAIEEEQMAAEIDFSNGVRGMHHVPEGAKVFLPRRLSEASASFSRRAEPRGVGLSELLSDVLECA